jgi:formylglycine-generating enzyme required for sulfatase activity
MPRRETGLTLIENATYNVVIERLAINVTLIIIPGGTFQMGNVEDDSFGDLDEKPVHTVTVSSFAMSTYEITNAQYAKFLNEALTAGDVTADSSSVEGAKGAYSGLEYIRLSGYYDDFPDARCWITFNDGIFTVEKGKEIYPVVFVTWYGSKAFALYYGLDLATEAEWEYACRGGRQYKYGTDDGTLSTSKANYEYIFGHPVAVGSYPANPYGLHDMSGNVEEWCTDWFEPYKSVSVIDPVGANTGIARVLRGSGWGGAYYICRSANRSSNYPNYTHGSTGFRVVRRP